MMQESLQFKPDEAFALRMDEQDPLRGYRDRFNFPQRPDSSPVIYFCGNSLGLQPKAARRLIEQELDDWSALAVGGHLKARTPWYSYHEIFRESGARLVGAEPGEVVMMNGLTINLHLMMISFYRPTPTRYKILIEEPAFPSDTYAVQTQLRYHGFDPRTGVVVAKPRENEQTVRLEDIEALLERHGSEIALVMLGGVNFFTGQVFDMARITSAAKKHGCVVGFDLAHAAGNVELRLHDWQVDFAVWCSYKYLNGGPGAVAGCFVHHKHGDDDKLPRFGGWWGNDPETRFRLHLNPDFLPRQGADGWQVSNPPIFSMAPLSASLGMFDEAGMPALRRKSEQLTGYLQFMIDQHPAPDLEIITPREPAARGNQLSIMARERARDYHQALAAEGVVCDFREPNVIRVAPTPLYNTFHEVWRFVQVLARD